jgi:hypothetical protein
MNKKISAKVTVKAIEEVKNARPYWMKYGVSEDRILNISNDISEDMMDSRVSVKELKACVSYWQWHHDQQINKFSEYKGNVAEALLVMMSSVLGGTSKNADKGIPLNQSLDILGSEKSVKGVDKTGKV